MPSVKKPPAAIDSPAGQPVLKKTRVKSIVVIISTILMLILISVFIWRVAYFANLIRTGEINTLDLRFAGNQTTSSLVGSDLEDTAVVSLATLDDPYLGSRDAKVTIVVFSDFSCPYCRQSSFIMRSLAVKYGDQINYIFRDFPMSEIYPQALLAAQAANCAFRQDKFWEYHDKLFINQSRQKEDDLLRYAREINLDLGLFWVCLSDQEVEKEILDDFTDGAQAGVYGTPTFFINGRRIPGSIPESVLESMIESILAVD